MQRYGRLPQWETTSMEDDLNGRRPQWKTTSLEDNLNGRHLNGRQPQWKTTSKKSSMEDTITRKLIKKNYLQEASSFAKTHFKLMELC